MSASVLLWLLACEQEHPYPPAMPDNPDRSIWHPWLRVSRLIRGITETHLGADVWPDEEGARWALAELGRLRRSPWWN
jgi:hypothetical protein